MRPTVRLSRRKGHDAQKDGLRHDLRQTSRPAKANSSNSPDLSGALLEAVNTETLRSGRQAPALAGLILLDLSARLIYADAETLRVLTFPEYNSSTGDFARLLPAEIKSMLLSQTCGEHSSYIAEFTSGRRRYTCRVVIINHNSGEPSRAMTALLIERSLTRGLHISEMANQFRLTQREQETIRLLMLGLTSKEIAIRMTISPHTVDTFFRNIRSKMAVSSRSAIISKLAGAGPPCAHCARGWSYPGSRKG